MRKKVVVDNLIEDMFGFRRPEQPVKTAAPVLAPTRPARPKNVEDTAHVLFEALQAYTGKRRRPLDGWKPLVAKALGVSRLYQKRFDEVVKWGIEMGLFEIDSTTLSYPFLVVVEPEPEEEIDPDVLASQEAQRRRAEEAAKPRPSPPAHPPEDWKPPYIGDCGHMSWSTDEAETAAKAEGNCCVAGSKKGAQVHWQFVKGEYKRPMPMAVRRSQEKEDGQGFAGLCSDDEGNYIGGVVNNCRYKNPDGPHCVVHRSKVSGDS